MIFIEFKMKDSYQWYVTSRPSREHNWIDQAIHWMIQYRIPYTYWRTQGRTFDTFGYLYRDLPNCTDVRGLAHTETYLITQMQDDCPIHILKQLVVLIYLMNVPWHLFLSSADDHPSLTMLLTCLLSPLSQKNYTGVLGTLTKKGNYDIILMTDIFFLNCNC